MSRETRDPLRKLAAGDRVLGSCQAAAQAWMAAPHLALALAAGTLALAREQGRPADSVLTEQLATFDHRDPDLVRSLLDSLASGWVPGGLVAVIDSGYSQPRIW